MIPIYKFRLDAGVHHDPASGNSYEAVPEKQIPPKEGAEDPAPQRIPAQLPVFESAIRLDLTYRNKFTLVPNDTPVTAKPDASALKAKSLNEAEAKKAVEEGATPQPRRRG